MLLPVSFILSVPWGIFSLPGAVFLPYSFEFTVLKIYLPNAVWRRYMGFVKTDQWKVKIRCKNTSSAGDRVRWLLKFNSCHFFCLRIDRLRSVVLSDNKWIFLAKTFSSWQAQLYTLVVYFPLLWIFAVLAYCIQEIIA